MPREPASTEVLSVGQLAKRCFAEAEGSDRQPLAQILERIAQAIEDLPDRLNRADDGTLTTATPSALQLRHLTGTQQFSARNSESPSRAPNGEIAYPVGEVAELLDKNPQTVRRLLRQGILDGAKDASGRWRVFERQLQDYLHGQRTVHGK